MKMAWLHNDEATMKVFAELNRRRLTLLAARKYKETTLSALPVDVVRLIAQHLHL